MNSNVLIFCVLTTFVRLQASECGFLTGGDNVHAHLVDQFDVVREYVRFPPAEQFDSPFHRTIKEALLKLDTSQRAIDVVLEEASTNKELDVTDRQVYKSVFSITRRSDRCPKQLVEIYLSIWAQSIDHAPELAPFYKFMRDSDPQRFRLCARRVNREFATNPSEVEATDEFFEIMRQTFGLKPEVDPKKLYENLVNFSFVRSKFDVRQMVRAGKEIETESTRYIDDGYTFLRYFWLTRCEQFDEDPLDRMLNIVSFTRGISFNYRDFDIRLLLQNEYRRLCYEWTNFSPLQDDPVKENIRRQSQKTLKETFRNIAKLFVPSSNNTITETSG